MRKPNYRGPDETDWGLPEFTGNQVWNDLRYALGDVFHHLFVHSAEVRRLQRDLARSPGSVKVSVGSGRTVPEGGWVGLDYRKGNHIYRCDLRKPLPFKDRTVDIVLAEHIVEHFWLDDIPGFISEFYRILKPGGIVRVVCPDAMIVCALLQGEQNERTEMQQRMDARMHKWRPEAATPLRVANRMAYEFGNHKALLTEDALVYLLADARFSGIKTTTIDKTVYFDSAPGTHLARYPDGILEAIVVEAIRGPEE